MIRFRKAVLIIHGFAGGTYDQEILANFLELNRKLDVYAFTLPGHDVKARDKATCDAWIKESEKQLKYLIDNGYKKIYLIGHSMGGVIACYLATKYKEVSRLVLAAPAFSCLASKEEGGFLNAALKGPSLIKTYSTDEFFTRIKKLPITAVPEFMKLVKKYQSSPESIKIPVLLLHGNLDQIVPISSSENIYTKFTNNKKIFITVDEYYHDLFKGEKVDILCHEIESFLTKRKFMIKEERKKI